MARKRIIEVGMARRFVLETPITGPDECPQCGVRAYVTAVEDDSDLPDGQMKAVGRKCLMCGYARIRKGDQGDLVVSHSFHEEELSASVQISGEGSSEVSAKRSRKANVRAEDDS